MKLLVIILLLFSACKQKQGFQFIETPKKSEPVKAYSTNEYFLQTNLDVLIVVDNSGSMSDKQAALASNAQLIIDSLVKNNVMFTIHSHNVYAAMKMRDRLKALGLCVRYKPFGTNEII